MTQIQRVGSPRFVRVLCTLGPASLDAATICRLTERNVDLFRINLSHTSLDAVAPTIELIQAHSSVPVCLDTEGAQVRTGKMTADVVVADAAHMRLTPESVVGTAELLTLTPASVFDELRPGNLIGLDFDGVVLLVVEVDERGVNTIVLNGGRIGSNKAVVVTPAPQLPALSEKDRAAVAIGREHGLAHFALSFANSADDIAELRELVGPEATIISKIESKRGVLNLDEILSATDEILIDRGDLSREVPLENIPLLQKAIIRKANLNKVPVNVATNLLESMIANRKPTRAELNDIINTLLDGANGLVLAAETAIGQHPVGAVDMVLNMIERHRRSVEGYRIEDLLDAGPTLLPSLHGRTTLQTWPSRRKSGLSSGGVARLPAIEIDAETLLDVEQLAGGVFSPLRGFMTEAELGIGTRSSPPAGWRSLAAADRAAGQRPGVCRISAGPVGATGRPADGPGGGDIAPGGQIRDRSRSSVAERWFGTSDRSHPGVRRFVNRGLTLLGGPARAAGAHIEREVALRTDSGANADAVRHQGLDEGRGVSCTEPTGPRPGAPGGTRGRAVARRRGVDSGGGGSAAGGRNRGEGRAGRISAVGAAGVSQCAAGGAGHLSTTCRPAGSGVCGAGEQEFRLHALRAGPQSGGPRVI